MGAMLMVNENSRSRRTRHIDIRHFAIMDWVQQDKMILARVDTQHNAVDSLSKANGRLKHHSHFDFLLGKYVAIDASAFISSAL